MFADIVTRGESVFKKLIEGSCPQSALVVTGGTFQVVRSAGMLCSLGALRFNAAFDGAYGVSAGIANIMYFLCDQAPLGTSIYYQDLLDNKFLCFLRWPPVDISYLAYEVAGRKKRLLDDRLLACRTVLRAVVTETNGKGRFLTVGREISPFDALNIGQSFIIWGNGFVCHAGGCYSDGFASEPIPFRQALADGYRNILVLLNMPTGWRYRRENILLRALKLPWFAGKPELRQAYFRRQKRYREQLDDLLHGPIDDANITIIAPSARCIRLPFYTRNGELLRRGAEEGIKIIEEAYGAPIQVELP